MRIKDGFLDDAPIFTDVRTFDGLPYRGKVDCITAGFPCQPFSGAARGRQRSEKNLWPDALRVIEEASPRYVFLENVSKRAINVAGDDCEAWQKDQKQAELVKELQARKKEIAKNAA